MGQVRFENVREGQDFGLEQFGYEYKKVSPREWDTEKNAQFGSTVFYLSVSADELVWVRRCTFCGTDDGALPAFYYIETDHVIKHYEVSGASLCDVCMERKGGWR